MKAATELHPNVLNKLLSNFVVNTGPVSSRKIAKTERELGIKVPWAILMDPTAACNLKCIGCWAAEYGKESEMGDELISRIIREGKELGIYFYAYTGGEPLVRKDSLIRLAEEHNDCVFMAFTNGTLVDNAFAAEMQRVGNLALAISVEGFEEETDMRRGRGTYQRVMKAMDILRDRGLLFGYSTCYHRYNTEVVGSEAYVDHMVAKGARFAWYFTYMPLGKDARPDLLAEPEQRAYMYRRIREVRATHPLFAMDFWNDGEYVEGCIAGGRKYFHINANGDVEPCAFIHYADVNIHDVSLLEALRSPLFMAYQRNQPFNSNHLRPCPLLDNPAALEQMVRETGAKSTQPGDHEDVGGTVRQVSRGFTALGDHRGRAMGGARTTGRSGAVGLAETHADPTAGQGRFTRRRERCMLIVARLYVTGPTGVRHRARSWLAEGMAGGAMGSAHPAACAPRRRQPAMIEAGGMCLCPELSKGPRCASRKSWMLPRPYSWKRAMPRPPSRISFARCPWQKGWSITTFAPKTISLRLCYSKKCKSLSMMCVSSVLRATDLP